GSWTPLGPSAVRPLANPRLAVFVGANGSTSSFPPADIAYVEIETPAPLAPALAVNPTSLSFSGSAGGSNPAGKNVSITNGGSGTLTWLASADQSWVTLSPSSGSAPSSLSVGVLTVGLAIGTHNATVTITSPEVTNSPRTVAVSFSVSAPSVGPARTDFTYSDRATLRADGWDFLARTSSGGTRNTEQTTGRVVS